MLAFHDCTDLRKGRAAAATFTTVFATNHMRMCVCVMRHTTTDVCVCVTHLNDPTPMCRWSASLPSYIPAIPVCHSYIQHEYYFGLQKCVATNFVFDNQINKRANGRCHINNALHIHQRLKKNCLFGVCEDRAYRGERVFGVGHQRQCFWTRQITPPTTTTHRSTTKKTHT